MPSFAALRSRLSARSARALDAVEVDALVWAWRLACIGAGVGVVVNTVTGPTESVPRIVSVVLGPPTRLLVQLLPGQLAADLRRAAHRLAGSLGAHSLHVQEAARGYVTVELRASDPLAGVTQLRLPTGRHEVIVGQLDDGRLLAVPPDDLPHLVVQGQTRSGKSTWIYGLLAQLVDHPEPVIVAGVDPSGLTFRPFAGSTHERWQCSGLADLGRVLDVLQLVVRTMDERLAEIPEGHDVLPAGAAPLLVVVLEEYPGLLRALDAEDPKLGKRCRALVARLLAESHKVRVRVTLAAQRAEATIVGAAERAQCAGRLSFRVDSVESVRLLHPDAEDLAPGHFTAAPGVALVTWPEEAPARLRAPLLTYAEFTRAIRARVAPPAAA